MQEEKENGDFTEENKSIIIACLCDRNPKIPMCLFLYNMHKIS